ncbi:MAG: hypothetical protein AUJ74_03410 [Candidatus Omnitrophica bacterium CG1_02_44_16]|nr:MAG: hypothetical protein AUJ74_03410 [Candidatus Omnitrophica bacterium CG1_02_44_16]
MAQIHKQFSTDQVKDLFKRYMDKQIERTYIQELLGIKRSQFFSLLKEYKADTNKFSINYIRKSPKRLSPEVEENIIKELIIDKGAIENKDIPLKYYNYSYIKDRLVKVYNQTASLPTVIKYAKDHDFYIPRKEHKKVHDREVLTRYIGELIQHDASYHLWAPAAKQKWCLITSLDDHSRYIPYGKFEEHESSWAHIQALQSVVIKHGSPYSYYVDCHSIFRYVRGRDQIHHRFEKFTDDVDPQWKQVLIDCKIKPIYALSPQAKGKIERPYQWLQDRIIRSCIRENVKTIAHGQRVLNAELDRYNHEQIHSTTNEIPYIRFQNAKEQGKSLFRQFTIPLPYLSYKDIFAFRTTRFVDQYCKVTVKNLPVRLKDVEPRQSVDIRVYPLNDSLIELRFWHRNRLIETLRVKKSELGLSSFQL